MTNAMIIFWQSVELMNAGVIGTTGRTLTVDLPDGSSQTIMEPEPIHTFACWKELGYSVKKGEHAVASFMIWKGSEVHLKDEDGNETDEKSTRMFRKLAFFFKASQVEASENRPKRRKAPRKPPLVPDLPGVPAPDTDALSAVS